MNYYSTNSHLYSLLSKVVQDTQIISVIPVNEKVLYPTRPRLEESKFVVSEDSYATRDSVVTAHVIDEYRPNQLKMDRLMRETDKLLIDVLLEALGGIRGVPIQSD